MLSKAELEALAEKYEAKVSRAYQNYQETGDLMSNTEGMNVDETVAKIRVPYTTVS